MCSFWDLVLMLPAPQYLRRAFSSVPGLHHFKPGFHVQRVDCQGNQVRARMGSGKLITNTRAQSTFSFSKPKDRAGALASASRISSGISGSLKPCCSVKRKGFPREAKGHFHLMMLNHLLHRLICTFSISLT